MKKFSKKGFIPWKYNTSTICDMYGLTPKGLFYYEKKNIIAPQRDSQNHYREFKLEDIVNLHQCRTLRCYDFPLDKCEEHLSEISLNTVIEDYKLRKEALLEEANYKKKLSVQLQETIDLLAKIKKGENLYKIKKSPQLIRVEILSNNKIQGISCGSTDDFKLWRDCMPFMKGSIWVKKSSVISDEIKFDCNIGFVISVDSANFYNICMNENTSVIPSCDCLYTIIKGSATELDSTERFKPMVKELHKRGLTLTRDAFTKVIGNFDFGDGMYRYSEAYFPIA